MQLSFNYQPQKLMRNGLVAKMVREEEETTGKTRKKSESFESVCLFAASFVSFIFCTKREATRTGK